MKTRVKVAAKGVDELCGGRAVTPGPVRDDGASPNSGTVEEGASEAVTLTLSFWPLVQWPDNVQLKKKSPIRSKVILVGP